MRYQSCSHYVQPEATISLRPKVISAAPSLPSSSLLLSLSSLLSSSPSPQPSSDPCPTPIVHPFLQLSFKNAMKSCAQSSKDGEVATVSLLIPVIPVMTGLIGVGGFTSTSKWNVDTSISPTLPLQSTKTTQISIIL
jgi:hypothetical protein